MSALAPEFMLAIGLVAGIVVGTGITAAITLEHEFWFFHCVRVPLALHQQLRLMARRDHTTVRAIIISRLVASFEGQRP